MSAAWRLATNSLGGRRLRTTLLTAAVALSAGLIVAISCGVASLNAALTGRIDRTLGVADVRITSVSDGAFSNKALDTALNWPDVAATLPRFAAPITLSKAGATSVAAGVGVDLTAEFAHRPLSLLAGRSPQAPSEIAIEERVATELNASIGDTINVESYYGGPPTLTVVGIAEKSEFFALTRAPATLDLKTLGEIAGKPNQLRSIDLVLTPGVDPLAFVDQHANDLDAGQILQATERITSGVKKNIRVQKVGLIVVSLVGFLAAMFIILTGLTTNVIEQQRQLAIVRSIGGSRGQVAFAQIIVGAIIGALGALFGVPFGIGVAYLGVRIFDEQLHSGLVVPPLGITLATVGAVLTGAIGAGWPAFLASRVSPLEALAVRAKNPARGAVWLSLLIGLTLVGGELLLLGTSHSPSRSFWSYILGGVEIMFIGYFFLGAPVALLLVRLFGPLIAKLTRTPRSLLTGTIAGAPFRHGMTAASLMVGLAMMIVIWTAGGAVVKQWLGKIDFPDAYVHGWSGLTPAQRDQIAALPFVTDTNAITMLNVDDDGAFGVKGLQDLGATFAAVEPEAFFRMTNITWIQGDPVTATARLNAGGAVIVAQEFNIAKGLGVGDTFTVRSKGAPITFDIVGVISSPGLEVVSRYFDIGKIYRHQAVSAVLGSRKDLVEKFGVDDIQLVQINLADTISDEDAVRQLRRLFAGSSLSVGSGREIKRAITHVADGAFLIMSTVALVAILIACLGVGNVIIAGVESRTFEFGVLRSIGAEGGLLGRMVLAEALGMALTAGVLGTLLGLQAAWSELRLYRQIAGLDLSLHPPILVIAAGWLIVTTLTLAAAGPPAWRLSRRSPRDLLTRAD